jgi:hypothetical protein
MRKSKDVCHQNIDLLNLKSNRPTYSKLVKTFEFKNRLMIELTQTKIDFKQD